ncbi:MAG: hypothetical protein H7Z37_05080 [Pyrinomonadaceae bacterium]|nr:hypothetical protein [Pyrinomonadaceae bacterium]
MSQKSLNGKLKFSSFNVRDAMKRLGLISLEEWKFDFEHIQPTPFFEERIKRLKNHFDLASTERAKEILIEAICEEVLTRYPKIKVWKSAPLASDDLIGSADYLITAQRRYIETPLLCVVEAKRDDFEKGLAQCLVEMQACRWNNERDGEKIDIYGIVSNGESWKFYKYDVGGKVFESEIFAFSDEPKLLGALSYVFERCEKNLDEH